MQYFKQILFFVFLKRFIQIQNLWNIFFAFIFFFYNEIYIIIGIALILQKSLIHN